MEDNKVINFKRKTDELKFDEEIEKDGYLKLTVLNCLEMLNFEPNEESIIEIQKTLDLEPTGVIGFEELGLLIYNAFEPDERQKVIDHIDECCTSNKKKDTWIAVLIITFFVFFFWGLIDFWLTIWGVAEKLFQTLM